MRYRYRIEVRKEDQWGNDSPVEFANTQAEARKIRTRMAHGQGLLSHSIRITRKLL